ncbi:hypothetical protein ALC62_15016, partial [Cyphomyrmex costatus]
INNIFFSSTLTDSGYIHTCIDSTITRAVT